MSPALDATTTRAEALRILTEAFVQGGIECAGQNARLLLCDAGGFSPTGLVAEPLRPLGPEALQKLAVMAQRRLREEPVSRILGLRGFWTLDLIVTPDVLDPRADSETLVSAVVEAMQARRGEALSILDLGTGSGALLLALLSEFPKAQGTAVDISGAALEVAARNARECGLADRARFVQGSWDAAEGPFDIVVSNPPYIPSAEIESLDSSVKDFDPRLALDGGTDGLDAYRAIAGVLPALLAPGGFVALEIGHDQARDVEPLLKKFDFKGISTHPDLGNKDRVVSGWRSK